MCSSTSVSVTRVIAHAAIAEVAGVDPMHRRTGVARRARGGARVQLDPFDRPAVALGGVHEAAGVRADVEQPATRGVPPAPQLTENPLEDEVLVRRRELALDPVLRPLLVVHPIEEARQRRQRFGLAEAADPAADEPRQLPTVGVKLRVLVDIGTEVEGQRMESSHGGAAAHPARRDRAEQDGRRRRGGEGARHVPGRCGREVKGGWHARST